MRTVRHADLADSMISRRPQFSAVPFAGQALWLCASRDASLRVPLWASPGSPAAVWRSWPLISNDPSRGREHGATHGGVGWIPRTNKMEYSSPTARQIQHRSRFREIALPFDPVARVPGFPPDPGPSDRRLRHATGHGLGRAHQLIVRNPIALAAPRRISQNVYISRRLVAGHERVVQPGDGFRRRACLGLSSALSVGALPSIRRDPLAHIPSPASTTALIAKLAA